MVTQDLPYAVRVLLKNPAFAPVAILSLAPVVAQLRVPIPSA